MTHWELVQSLWVALLGSNANEGGFTFIMLTAHDNCVLYAVETWAPHTIANEILDQSTQESWLVTWTDLHQMLELGFAEQTLLYVSLRDSQNG